jgi:hypothetical protein
VVGFVSSDIGSGKDAVLLTGGLVTPTKDENLVPNMPVYLSPITAGNVTPDSPTLSGQYIQQVGIAKTTSSMLIQIEETVLIS